MNSITNFVARGGCYRRGRYDAGYILVHTSDGKQHYYGETVSINNAIALTIAKGYDAADIVKRMDEPGGLNFRLS